ncbi:protein Njmu-R1-like isoform X3 [Biomphalaria glabrata]|uniref:Protein Njmu-R1-like isoform X3 n=1 Tax=Biomphalaria glabrata TaxID=6526 RepID=A0A9U8E131_BIOGL|nr:protein Njmu-R1-like isoform X3 [Biomphalaria glabrata]
MADSTSDSSSVQSLQVDQSSEKKIDNNRFYALYSFNAQKFSDLGPSTDNASTSTVEQADGSLSLNIIATNLTATTETDLRKSIAQRLSKNCPKSGDGVFLSVGLQNPKTSTSISISAAASVSASCYFCLIESTFDTLDFDLVSQEGKCSDIRPHEVQQFLVCFLSFQDSSLEQFRSDFDSYTQGLIPLLDKELSQLSTRIHNYLEQWPYVVLEYLTRTIQYFGSGIQHLLYSALLNANLQINDATEEQEDDIRRFINCVSISSLVEQLQSSESVKIETCPEFNDLWLLQPIVITITLRQGQSVTFDKTYSCNFCTQASEKLLSFDPTNVSKIKDFLETIKLTFVHCLNKLKRFLKQAELDYYALYRSFSYLKKCGCGDMLLRYVKLDGGPETLSVLSVLETFIKDMKLTLM